MFSGIVTHKPVWTNGQKRHHRVGINAIDRLNRLKTLFDFNSRIMLVGLACVTESRETMAYVSYRLVPSADWDGD